MRACFRLCIYPNTISGHNKSAGCPALLLIFTRVAYVVLPFFLAVDTAAEVPNVSQIVEIIRKKFADPVLEFFDNTFFCISG